MTSLGNFTIVALFVRVPIPGRVKTRLAQDLGEHDACELYKAMVADILENTKVSGFPIYLFHDGVDSKGLPQEWMEASDKVIVQTGESIGERMAAAFEYCFDNNVDQVILIGSDIPGIDSGILLKAAMTLKFHDITIAPVVDGGYCLIAMKRNTYLPMIFKDISWSTDAVLRDTLEKCEVFQIEVELLEVLQDIDTIDDLKSYRLNPSSTACATNKWIENAGTIKWTIHKHQ